MLSLAIISWGAFAQNDYSSMNHSEKDQGKMDMKDNSSASASITVKHSKSASAVIDRYLKLKKALVEDNSQKAASESKNLFDAFAKFNLSAKSNSEQKELSEIIEDASEHAEHISENSGNLDHQREHFETLSNDIRDLIVIAGSDRTLYQMYCPMYNNGDGSMWLSSSIEVKNPFYGSKMMKCGSVQQEFTIK